MKLNRKVAEIFLAMRVFVEIQSSVQIVIQCKMAKRHG